VGYNGVARVDNAYLSFLLTTFVHLIMLLVYTLAYINCNFI
jgi:hypothetical protein